MIDLEQYKTVGEWSFYKGIPIEHLEEVKAQLRAEGRGNYRIRYRGQRNNPLDTRSSTQRYQQCLKRFAQSFAIYFDDAPYYSMTLSSVGNPDFGQDPNCRLWGVADKYIRANSFDDIKQIAREWIEDNDIGGGNWTCPALIYNDGISWSNRVEVGVVSYNMRVWKKIQTLEEVKELPL